MPKCGTNSGYTSGHRDLACRKAHREYNRSLYKRRPRAKTNIVQGGFAQGYADGFALKPNRYQPYLKGYADGEADRRRADRAQPKPAVGGRPRPRPTDAQQTFNHAISKAV